MKIFEVIFKVLGQSVFRISGTLGGASGIEFFDEEGK